MAEEPANEHMFDNVVQHFDTKKSFSSNKNLNKNVSEINVLGYGGVCQWRHVENRQSYDDIVHRHSHLFLLFVSKQEFSSAVFTKVDGIFKQMEKSILDFLNWKFDFKNSTWVKFKFFVSFIDRSCQKTINPARKFVILIRFFLFWGFLFSTQKIESWHRKRIKLALWFPISFCHCTRYGHP